MKQKCSSILKIAVALVLALLMVFGSVSTVLAAVVQPALLGAASSVAGTAANADLAGTGAYTTLANKTIYFDNTNTNYGTVYLYIGHGSYAKSYTMTNTGSHNIWKISFDSNTAWTDRTKLYFSSRDDSPNGQNYSIDVQHGWPSNNQKTNLIAANDADGGSCFFPAGNSNSSLTRRPIRVVVGDLSSSGWDNKADLMSYSSNTHSFTYSNVSADTYSLAVVGFDDWNTAYRWAAKGTLTDNGAGSWADAQDGDHNIKLTLTKAADVTITLTSSNKVNITLTPKTTPAIDTFTVSKSSVLIGKTATLSSTTSNTSSSATVAYSIKSGSSYVSLSGTTVTAVAPGKATLQATLTDGSVTETKELEVTAYAYYLAGLGAGWDDAAAKRFTYDTARQVWSLTKTGITAKTYSGDTDGFKIRRTDDTSKYYGHASGDTMTRQYADGIAWDLTSPGNNLGLKADVAGTYIFDLTLDANDAPQKITAHYPQKINYDKNGKTTTSFPTTPVYVTYNTAIGSAPTAPTATGYVFGGWYKEAACTNAWNFSTDTVTATTTLYAKWTKDPHTITYATGTGFDYSDNTTTSAGYGDTVSFKVTAKSGYRIDSVKFTPDGGSATNCTAGSNNTYSFTMPDKNVSVSVTTVKQYTVTLSADSGVNTKTYKIGSAATGTAYSAPITVDSGTQVVFDVTYKNTHYYDNSTGATASNSNKTFTINSVSADTTVTITTAAKTNLSAPAITINGSAAASEAAAVAINGTDTFTLKITNYAALKDYCDFTVKYGTGATASTTLSGVSFNSSGEATVTPPDAIKQYQYKGSTVPGSIKVTAALKSAYTGTHLINSTTSANSNTARVKVYKPRYELAGNVDLISGSGKSDAMWGSGQNGISTGINIATPVSGRPGVYTYTFTTTSGDGDAYFEFYSKSGTNTRKALLGHDTTTYYNSNGSNLDATAGITEANCAYIQTVDSGNPGGGFKVSRNKTYTIYIDQTDTTNGDCDGAVWIANDNWNVTAVAKVNSYNSETGKYDAVTDATAAQGSVTGGGAIKIGQSATLTATAGTDYEFKGWYSDADCKTKITGTGTGAYTFTPSADTTVYALFAHSGSPIAITAKSNKATLGSVKVTPASAYPGDTITVTVTEIGGSYMSGSTKFQKNGTGNWTVITMKADTAGTGAFAAIGKMALAATGASLDLAATGATYSGTFTMPDDATSLTVSAEFDEYTAESDYYYNGYNKDSGAQVSGYYDQRMTEGKLGGVEYSYFNVNGRTESDQTFTVSKKTGATGTRYVYFTNNNTWNSVKAYFYNSSGTVGTAWSGTAMDKIGSNNFNQDIYKIAIPSGATSVIFNDGNNQQTVDISLENTNGSYYINGQQDGNWKVSEWDTPGENSGLGGSSTEYLYSADIYKTALGFNGGFFDHTINAINKTVAKPNNLGTDDRSDYYILVFYPGKKYTYNDETLDLTSSSDPVVVWSKTLPGEDASTKTSVTLYAKDGAAQIDWEHNKSAGGATNINGKGYNFAEIASTNITQIDGVAASGVKSGNSGGSSNYKYLDVEPGQTLTITTTIGSEYMDKYYVVGWNVNGVTYSGNNQTAVNTVQNTSDGLYTLTYTVPENIDRTIEITPIYYLTDSAKSGHTIVTFYLQNFTEEIQTTGGWGDTPYVYPFYGNLSGYQNSFGTYPGQPMVHVNGSYSMEIPVENTIAIANQPEGTTPIKGITISNGYADDVHRNKVYHWTTGTSVQDDKDHRQTYDYDDFYKIYYEKTKEYNGQTIHPNTITFRMKEEKNYYNANKYGGTTQSSARVYNKKSTLTAADITDITDNGNGWENLYNFFNQEVDLFGNVLDNPSDDGAIHVISTGYNANIAGDYGTAWMIYDADGNLIIDSANDRYAIPPSLLIMNYANNAFTNASVYPEANRSVTGVGTYTDKIAKYAGLREKLSAFAGKRVYITYEKNIQDNRNNTAGEGAYRLDGRWYYTFENDTVKADLAVEYWDATNREYKEATYSGTDNTVASAGNSEITTVKFDNNTKNSGEKVMKSGHYVFGATNTNATAWKFVGWYVKQDGNYTKMIGTPENNVDILAEINATFVARYEPHISGDLTINHSVSENSDGKGTATVSAVVKDGNNTVLTTINGTTKNGVDSLYIPNDYIDNEKTDYTVTVTLTATPSLDDTWSEFGYDAKFHTGDRTGASYFTEAGSGTATSPKTSTFTFTVGELFAAGGTQTFKTLNYTSAFNATDHYYKITYNYNNRDNVAKSYTAQGTFTADQYNTYVNSSREVSADFVTNIAPVVSNFNETLRMDLSGASVTTNEYDSNEKLHTVVANFGKSGTTFRAYFDLPYEYYDEAVNDDGSGSAGKMYTAKKESVGDGEFAVKKNENTAAVVISDIPYNAFFTSTGSQDKVSKDIVTVNHTENDFITAPDKIWDEAESKYKYFSYWAVYDYRDFESGKPQNAEITRVYYTDFHYRAIGNYYVVPVFDGDVQNSYVLANDQSGLTAKLLYLGSSRNQWNNDDGNAYSGTTQAADLIYNDFAFSFTDDGKILSEMTPAEKENIKIGLIIERVKDDDDNYVLGSENISDMAYYREQYAGTTAAAKSKTDLLNYLNRTAAKPSGIVQQEYENVTASLNEKNRMEKYYGFYSEYGQNAATKGQEIEFAKDSVVDNYVYRAYTYIIDDNRSEGNVALSDAVYFSMKNISTK